MSYEGEERRASAISLDDIERIAVAVADKEKTAFHIEEEVHYNQHKRLDKMLDAYDQATNIFWKTFLAMVIMGLIILTGITAMGTKK